MLVFICTGKSLSNQFKQRKCNYYSNLIKKKDKKSRFAVISFSYNVGVG